MVSFNKMHSVVYYSLFYITLLIYGIVYAKFANADTMLYLDIINTITEVYFGLFLMYRFNPFFTNYTPLSNIEKKIIFSAGTLIFMGSIGGAIVRSYTLKLQKAVDDKLPSSVI